MTMETPVFDVEVRKSISGSSWMASSMGSVTSCSMRAGLAPGNRVTTWATRTVKPGSSARDMPRYADRPPTSSSRSATAVTRLFSMAARVRSIAVLSAARRRRAARGRRRAGG